MGTWSKSVTRRAGHLKDQDYHWEFEKSYKLSESSGAALPTAGREEVSAAGVSFAWVERSSDPKWVGFLGPGNSNELGHGRDL